MKKAITTSLCFLISVSFLVAGQKVKTLNYQEFIKRVKNFHPLFQVNELQYEINANRIKSKRGSFDPTLRFEQQKKSFEGTEYFNLMSTGLDIPTWFGGKIGGGFDQNQGNYLNPENNTALGGQVYAYISQPILQGLLWDKRRSELKKAENYAKLNQAEQTLVMNQLIFEASQAYWQWFAAFHAREALRVNLVLGEDRLKAIKQKVLFGDMPPVDSVEATIQKDLREIAFRKGFLQEKNAKKELNKFLWTIEKTPVMVADQTIPQGIIESYDSLLEDTLNSREVIATSHPIFSQNEAKLAFIEIDRKMAVENLKPKLDLVYKPLNKATGNLVDNYSSSNYNLGIKMSVPVFFRQGRNALKIAHRKKTQNELSFILKQNELQVKLSQLNNEIATEKELVAQYQGLIKQYLIIVKAERTLLNEGESSLFLINRRESNLISSQLKFYESISKYQTLLAERKNILAEN